jgi:hypothetical protein
MNISLFRGVFLHSFFYLKLHGIAKRKFNYGIPFPVNNLSENDKKRIIPIKKFDVLYHIDFECINLYEAD